MQNIRTTGLTEIPRTGEEILRELGPVPVNLARCVHIMRGVSLEEIPGFTEAFAWRHPKFAAAMVNFVLDLAEMAPGTDLVWAECLANMRNARSQVTHLCKVNNDPDFIAARQAAQQSAVHTAL